jgi:hypothetical protein
MDRKIGWLSASLSTCQKPAGQQARDGACNERAVLRQN